MMLSFQSYSSILVDLAPNHFHVAKNGWFIYTVGHLNNKFYSDHAGMLPRFWEKNRYTTFKQNLPFFELNPIEGTTNLILL